MQVTHQRDTPGELALRSLLRALGLRYRVDVTLPGTRRRPDVASRAKVAVFVDGCFSARLSHSRNMAEGERRVVAWNIEATAAATTIPTAG